MKASRLLCLLPLLLAVSCARPPDRPAAAGLSFPGAWQAGNPALGSVKDAWWEQFSDSTLNDWIAEVLAHNHDLRAAAARLEVAMAEANIAGARRLPTLGWGAQAERNRRNLIGIPLPGTEEDPLVVHSTLLGLNLNTSWELDLWGRIKSSHEAARAMVEASAADLAGSRLSLAGQTTKAWLALIESAQQVALAERTRDTFAQTAERIQERYERGLRPPLDVRLAQANVAGAEAALASRRITHQRAMRQLEILLGRYPAGELSAPSAYPDMPEPVPAGLPSEILARRPDLRASERELKAADWRLAESKATLLPRLSLTASGGTSSEDLADLLSSDFRVWTLAGNLTQPLFEGGRLRAGVRRAEARVRQAVAEYQSLVLRAFAEVEVALVSGDMLRRREEDLREAVLQSRAALELAEARYGLGIDNIITVLESQRRLFEAETQHVLVRRLRLENRVDLHLALGGGFPSRAPEPPRASQPSQALEEPGS